MTPTPIRQVLFTIQKHQVQALLMGGQACVFYGAVQVSKDVDLLILAEEENFRRFLRAMEDLQAKRISIPPFLPEALVELCEIFPSHAAALEGERPLLALATAPDFSKLREALGAEVLREQEKDRRYWEPLKREMEEFRRAERLDSGNA